MPRPKKVQPVEETFESNVEELVLEESASVESPQEEVKSEEKPPEQVLKPFYIKSVKRMMGDDDEDEVDTEQTLEVLPEEEVVSEASVTKFAVYSNGEYLETVDDTSTGLLKYLDLNRAELDNRIQELWQVPNDPNDLIFFNFGPQKMSYNSYNAYFNVNGFAPIEPKVKSWMEYYLRLHNPITEEEIAIKLKGPLQYSFIPIKS